MSTTWHVPVYELDDLVTVLRLGDHGDSVGRAQDAGQPAPRQRVVVNEQHSEWCFVVVTLAHGYMVARTALRAAAARAARR